jgi:putative membrane protein
MLLVHPIHEVLRQLPLLIGSLVLGYSTDNPIWSVAALVFMVGYGVARWFTTTYRIDAEQLQRREGVLHRKVLSLPRNRIRSVSTDARLLHRLLGLTVVTVGTGQEARGEAAFELDAVRTDEVAGLRAVLLADSRAATADDVRVAERVLARWRPSWLRYSPLSFTGLAMIAGAIGIGYQTGVVAALEESRFSRAGIAAAERLGATATVAATATVLVLLSVLLSVLRSLLVYGNLVLSQRDDGGGGGVLQLRHGLLRVRELSYDTSRLRGGTLREPLLVRVFGGARLDAAMTGVGGAGEASLLLPPCPRATAEAVLTSLTGPDPVSGQLRRHGPAAVRRRWTRALILPVVLAGALVVLTPWVSVPARAWVGCAVLAAGSVFLAVDRSRALGHRVVDGWVVARSGSLDRRRDCIAAAGVIGWTVRQTLFQRRAGVATLVAATAAGAKAYRILDVPEERAWAVAAAASPWVSDNEWAQSAPGAVG